jgi:Mlc titration factor MtfA (ptsG expression regulator)
VKILKLSNGKELTIERDSNVGIDVLGDNDSEGNIRIADLTFTYTEDFSPDAVIIHEIGHNWDTDDENPGVKTFFDLSKWKGDDPFWTFDPHAKFARAYAKTNPYEDFATTLEVYYSNFTAPSTFQAKWDWMDNWLNTMH